MDMNKLEFDEGWWKLYCCRVFILQTSEFNL